MIGKIQNNPAVSFGKLTIDKSDETKKALYKLGAQDLNLLADAFERLDKGSGSSDIVLSGKINCVPGLTCNGVPVDGVDLYVHEAEAFNANVRDQKSGDYYAGPRDNALSDEFINLHPDSEMSVQGELNSLVSTALGKIEVKTEELKVDDILNKYQ